jgi:eukaryotic-like serine/threonine-protein kinase
MSETPDTSPSDADDIAPLLRMGLDDETLRTPAPTVDDDATVITSAPRPSFATQGEGQAAGSMIGPYRLIEVLGEGGFGIVWRAEQREPILREVALKVIKQGMDSREIITRFEAERQALALMDHPNIAGVLDAGKTSSGQLYFAMEMVRGLPLTEHCDAHRLTLRQRLELFIPVCQAVQHAHQKGVLHRDCRCTET